MRVINECLHNTRYEPFKLAVIFTLERGLLGGGLLFLVYYCMFDFSQFQEKNINVLSLGFHFILFSS